MKVSVIIPTYNGAHKILNILKCIESQSKKPDETLIVIDGSTDDTQKIVEQANLKIPNLKIFWQQNGGRSKVRNYGASEASGELLIFFDDDMLPENKCVDVHLNHHLANKNTILTGAQIDVNSPEISDIRKYKSYLTKKWAQPLNKDVLTPLAKNDTFITAANFSIAKDLFKKLGGFDEQLSDAEDYDLAERAVESGIPLFYNEKAFALHDDVISCRSYIKRQREYTLAQEKLQLLRSGRISKYSFSMPTGFKKVCFQFFCFSFWISTIDKNIWTYILPKAARYKLYDWVITANARYFPEKVKL